jgi:multicomponent Na+:H+ antiporter subunit A
LNGLAKKLPVNFTSTILAVISLASLPPLFGFIGKEALVKTMLEDRPLSEIGLVALVIGSSIFVYISLEFVLKPFTGKKLEPARDSVSEHHYTMHWTPLLPGLAALFLGFYPKVLDKLSGAFGLAVSGSEEIPHVKLWHGFNTEVVVSLVTLILGSAVYWWAGRKNLFYSRPVPELKTIYQFSRPILRMLAARVTQTLQYGILRNYLAIIISGWMLLMVLVLLIGPFPGFPELKFDPGPYELMVVLVMMVIVGILFRLDSRLSIIVFMSFSGFLVAMVFGLFSAPDLSITQLLVETLMLSIFLLLLHRMPGYRIYETKFKSWLFLPVSLLFGFGISGLLWWLYDFKSDSILKSFYLEQAKPLGKGENVVNVILVDFRAFDTMGEVTVLGIAAIGVYALLKNK